MNIDRHRCKCGRPLIPCPARRDGEDTFVGFKACVCSHDAFLENRYDGEDEEEYQQRIAIENPVPAAAAKKTFVVPGMLRRAKGSARRRRKPENVSCFIDAKDEEDAKWQVDHGVIEANVSRDFGPEAEITYDKRKLHLLGGV